MNPLQEFLKEAGFWSDVGRAVASTAKAAIAPTIVGIGIGGGLHIAEKGFSAVQDRLTKQRDYQAMLASNPNLKKMDAGDVQKVYNSLRHMAPDLASDPLVAGSFVRRTLEMSSPPAIDVATVKSITDSQRNIGGGEGMRPYRDIAMAVGTRAPMLQGERSYDEHGQLISRKEKIYR